MYPILEDEDRPALLGEEGAPPDDAKAVLKTREGVNWTATPEKTGKR